MNTKKNFILSSICALGGALFYAMHQGWIIVNIPTITTGQLTKPVCIPQVTKKTVTLYFWRHETWHHETTQLVWTEHEAQNISYLINSWLSLLDDEKITSKKISLQTAMFNQSGNELYLSFDHALFSKEATTYDKWMLIEGLLKTLRENGFSNNAMRFLVHHQSMNDAHLDFNSPWPMHGFMAG